MSSLPRRGIVVFLTGLLLLGTAILALWYGMNSDRDDIHPLLTQLIPAGHCACESATIFKCDSCLKCPATIKTDEARRDWKFDPGRDSKNSTFTKNQCLASFPGLFEDIEHAKGFWNGQITKYTLDQYQMRDGTTRVLIMGGELYVIATRSKAEDHRRKTIAALSAIYRAISSAPDRMAIPNIEFIFSIEDKGEDIGASGHPLWVLARKATESLWLMPDFGYWAWDNIIGDSNNEIGPFDEVVEKALVIERDLPFPKKEPKLVWRGKLSFAPKLRRALMDQARGHEWGDVKELNWQVRDNYLTLEDHCRYQFIAHAEGRSYSASLKYRQACTSVPVIHKMQYIQHHHYLLVSEGPLQNYVEVERDFSDLPQKMANLLDHPEKARAIAQNSVKTFRNRYLTQAAEACYWRRLFDGYGEVFTGAKLFEEKNDGTVLKRGLRYETFLLLDNESMLNYGPIAGHRKLGETTRLSSSAGIAIMAAKMGQASKTNRSRRLTGYYSGAVTLADNLHSWQE